MSGEPCGRLGGGRRRAHFDDGLVVRATEVGVGDCCHRSTSTMIPGLLVASSCFMTRHPVPLRAATMHTAWELPAVSPRRRHCEPSSWRTVGRGIHRLTKRKCTVIRARHMNLLLGEALCDWAALSLVAASVVHGSALPWQSPEHRKGTSGVNRTKSAERGAARLGSLLAPFKVPG